MAQHLEVEDWQAVVVYPRRSLEQKNRYRHRSLLNSEQFQAIYLEDFLEATSTKLGIQLMQLMVSQDSQTAEYLQPIVQTLQGKTDPQNQAIID